MFCDHCGKQIPEDSTFCPYCGADLKVTHDGIKPSPGVSTPQEQSTGQGTMVTAGMAQQESLKGSAGTTTESKTGAPSVEPPPSKRIIPGISNPQLLWVILTIVSTILLSLWWPSGLSLLSPLVLLTGVCVIIAGITKGTLRRAVGAGGALLAVFSLGIILREAFRSSTTYFGDVTYYGYEIDTYLLILSLIGGVILLWLGIRAVRRPFQKTPPPADRGVAVGQKKKLPVLWIVIGIITIAIIGVVFVAPILFNSMLEQSIPRTTGIDGERTSPAPLHTPTVPTRSPTSSSTIRTPIPTGNGFVTITPNLPPPPVAAFQGDPIAGNVPLQVQFTDRSTGQPTVWLWDFGDGMTSSEKNPVHVYANPGTYTVTLKSINTGGSTSSRKLSYITALSSQSETPVPTATPQLISSFQYDMGRGPVPLTVQFTDTTQEGPITAYYWKFGDGTTSYEKNPVHTYTNAGTYWPELTVTTVYGNAWSMSGPITATSGIPTQIPASIITSPPVTAPLSPPQAAFVYDTDLGPVPLTVTFTDRSTGSPTSWLWDFGDGGTSTARNPSHTYNDVDSFYVTLTVQNTYGSSLVTQGPIEVFYRF